MPREQMFQHRLALAMGRTVSELKQSMSWRELQRWQMFDALHPLPGRLSDIHHGMLMSALCNLTRSADSPAAVAADYFVIREPRLEPEAETQPSELTEAERLQRMWHGG